MRSERNENHVALRLDNKGDRWANEHREAVGNHFLMQDIDGIVMEDATGVAVMDTEDQLFYEYVPNEWEHHSKTIRDFAYVAVFDRKKTEDVIEVSEVSRAVSLHLTRSLAGFNRPFPKFFYVVGTQPPWLMIELDVTTGKEVKRFTYTMENWVDVWKAAGLVTLRQQLKCMVERPRMPIKERIRRMQEEAKHRQAIADIWSRPVESR